MDQQPLQQPPQMGRPSQPQPQVQHAPENHAMNLPQKSSKGWMIVAILAIIVLLAVSALSYYKWQQYKTLVGNLGARINALENQVTSLEKQLAATKVTTKTTTIQTDEQQAITATENYTFATSSGVKSVSVTVNALEGTAALVTVTPTPTLLGFSNIYALKKQNGVWIVVYTGTVKPTAAQASSLGLPNTTQFHQ